MKKFVKILCCLGMAAVMIVPVFAESSVLLNQVRIVVDFKTVTSWDENINKDSDAPSSILYNDMTYVPLRWISENMEKKVVWNGDSKTVGILDEIHGERTPVSKTDLNGNEWAYSILHHEDEFPYLRILDKKRNYERCYRLANEEAYRLDDDAIWFVEKEKYGYSTVFRLPFLNDENSQDGEQIVSIGNVSEVKFDKDYMFFIRRIRGSTSPHDELGIVDLRTGKCGGGITPEVYSSEIWF